MDAFFSKKDCDRCHGDLRVRILSWFTDEVICMTCADKEDELRTKLKDNGIDYEGCGYIPTVLDQ